MCTQLVCDLILIEFYLCSLQFSLGTYKVCAIVTKEAKRVSSAGLETVECHDTGVCFQAMSDFQVKYTHVQTSEQADIPLL